MRLEMSIGIHVHTDEDVKEFCVRDVLQLYAYLVLKSLLDLDLFDY